MSAIVRPTSDNARQPAVESEDADRTCSTAAQR